MKRTLLGLSALALVATLGTACTETQTERVSERPIERAPSASPPTAVTPPPASSTAPSTSTDTTTSGAPATSSETTTSGAPATGSTSSPSTSGTK